MSPRAEKTRDWRHNDRPDRPRRAGRLSVCSRCGAQDVAHIAASECVITPRTPGGVVVKFTRLAYFFGVIPAGTVGRLVRCDPSTRLGSPHDAIVDIGVERRVHVQSTALEVIGL